MLDSGFGSGVSPIPTAAGASAERRLTMLKHKAPADQSGEEANPTVLAAALGHTWAVRLGLGLGAGFC